MQKPHLTQSPFLLLLDGPSCGGKSSVATLLLEQYGGIYGANGDKIKWQISDYTASVHRSIVHEMTLATAAIALESGLSVIKEGARWQPERLRQLAARHDAYFAVANVSAPKDVLDARFQERLALHRQGERISNLDQGRFDELYEQFMRDKLETDLTFDSSTQAPDAIAQAIVNYLQQHCGKPDTPSSS